jgi:hypothetical protein
LIIPGVHIRNSISQVHFKRSIDGQNLAAERIPIPLYYTPG